MNHNEYGTTRGIRGLIGLLLLVGGAGVAQAHDKEQETIGLVMQQSIPEAGGKIVTIATVRYAPGQSSDAHRHPGSIFAFVTEGAVVSQLAGEAEHTFTKGQGWYEPPGAKHLVSKNASAEKPAELVVFALSEKNQPVKTPLTNSDSR